jgi:tRNA (guanosine-2'-O-)-methyltransferase
VKQLDGTGMKRLHRDWRRVTEGRLALILDGVSTTFNVGGILRTAAALRVERVWFANGATSPSHPKVGRTALGAERYLSWTEAERTADAIAEARADGYTVIGIELAGGALPLHEVEIGGPTCLVIGHEDHGLNEATLGACDAVAFIPQLGKIGSLNVATAAGIALYEVRRREWTGRS